MLYCQTSYNTIIITANIALQFMKNSEFSEVIFSTSLLLVVLHLCYCNAVIVISCMSLLQKWNWNLSRTWEWGSNKPSDDSDQTEQLCPPKFKVLPAPMWCVGILVWATTVDKMGNKQFHVVWIFIIWCLFSFWNLNADSDTLHQFYTCNESSHILNMYVQYGTLTWQKRKPFWRQCKSLL